SDNGMGLGNDPFGNNSHPWWWIDTQQNTPRQQPPQFQAQVPYLVPQARPSMPQSGGGDGMETTVLQFDGTVNGPQVDGLGLFASPDDTAQTTVRVTWGDGTVETVTPDARGVFPLHHQYTTDGPRTITINVLDAQGNVISTNQQEYNFTAPRPADSAPADQG